METNNANNAYRVARQPARVGPLGLRIGTSRTLYEVTDYASASRIYCSLRDRSGLGVSGLPRARLYRAGAKVAEVSYNGRVWVGEECVYDPLGPGAMSTGAIEDEALYCDRCGVEVDPAAVRVPPYCDACAEGRP